MDKPQNSEKITENKEYFDRLRVLSGIKSEEPISEDKDKTEGKDKKEIIKESVFEPFTLIKDSVIKGSDGKNYGIIKENHKYFIKNATGTKTKEQLDESDFIYIGGIQNKLWRRYDSLAEAQKQLNFIMKNLNESYNHSYKINERNQIEETKVKEVKPGKDIKEQLGDNEEEKEEPELGVDVQEPVAADVPAEPSAEVGVEPAPDVAPEPVADVSPEVPSADVGEPGIEPSAEVGGDEVSEPEAVAEPGVEEPIGDELGDELGDLEEDPVEIIQSLTGKLAQKVRMAELTPELTKSTLNSIISALDLSIVDPEDRLVIAKKVKRGGVSKKEMELQEDFGDKVKGTQGMGKGKVKSIAGGGTTEKKKGEFGKSAKGTQSMGKGRLKAEGVERIEQIVLESLRKHKLNLNKPFTPPFKRKPVLKENKPSTIKGETISEEKNKQFTSKIEDLKSVEKLIESIVKKKSLI